eukprot:1012750_1
MEYHKKANKSFALATWQRIAANVQPELLAIAAIPDHKLFIDYLNQYHSDWSEKEQMNAWVAALTLCREEKKKDSPLKSSQVKLVSQTYSGSKDEEKAKILSKSYDTSLFHVHPYDIEQTCNLYKLAAPCFQCMLEFVYGVKCEAIQQRFNQGIPFDAVCGTVQHYICWAMTVKPRFHSA